MVASILTRGTQAEPGQGSGGLVKTEVYPGATRPPARTQGHRGREGQEGLSAVASGDAASGDAAWIPSN